MHEMSIISAVLESAFSKTNDRIVRLGLRVGALTNVVPEALQFAFEAATQGTLAEGAFLDVEFPPLTVRCADCECDFTAVDIAALCPRCGSARSALVNGREILLTYLEVQDDDKPAVGNGAT
jgi:hydrogenase nickel incorporation protein HypA/HybF